MNQSTDNTLTRQDMLDKSHKMLTAQKLIEILTDRTKQEDIFIIILGLSIWLTHLKMEI